METAAQNKATGSHRGHLDVLPPKKQKRSLRSESVRKSPAGHRTETAFEEKNVTAVLRERFLPLFLLFLYPRIKLATDDNLCTVPGCFANDLELPNPGPNLKKKEGVQFIETGWFRNLMRSSSSRSVHLAAGKFAHTSESRSVPRPHVFLACGIRRSRHTQPRSFGCCLGSQRPCLFFLRSGRDFFPRSFFRIRPSSYPHAALGQRQPKLVFGTCSLLFSRYR